MCLHPLESVHRGPSLGPLRLENFRSVASEQGVDLQHWAPSLPRPRQPLPEPVKVHKPPVRSLLMAPPLHEDRQSASVDLWEELSGNGQQAGTELPNSAVLIILWTRPYGGSGNGIPV